jgi:DNA-binding XRE family transcriptional regulator
MDKRPTHKSFKKEVLDIPGVREEYEALEEEFALIGELIRARKMAGKSQEEVAKLMKTTPSVISRLEAGYGRQRHIPSMNTLRRYANAVGCRLSVILVPKKRHAG